ncbi:MAG TPA: sugar phosphate isomerase/epimerase [Longimicrobiaceae bacterium]|nr:sugar phosphate isomerase/epimerase [Longimicrobiaceae bacterium]
MSEQKMERRGFLRAAAAGAAGVAALGLPAPARAERRAGREGGPAPAGGVRLGVASYSLRNFPRAKAIEMIQALRTPYVNIKSVHLPYDLSPAEIAAARREFETAGLKIVGGGTITFDEDSDAGVQRYFDYARAAGMPLMVVTGAPAVFPRVERFARRYDIRVAIHNHGPEDEHFPSPYDALKVVRGMDPRMGICMDIGHTERAGVDPVQAAADAGPRLLDMHAKDLSELRVKESQVAVGEGKIPFAALFRQLERQRYPGYVNLEYEVHPEDPMPGMRESFAYMRGCLAGLATARAPAR